MKPGAGDVAPDFELRSDEGATVRLSALRGRKVVLFFYPRADTPACTTEACEFSGLERSFAERGAAVYGISPDPVKALQRFRKKFGLTYPLLSDPAGEVARRYGVWKEKKMFGRSFLGVERSTFVIDEEGRIAGEYRGVRAEGHAAEVLAGL